MLPAAAVAALVLAGGAAAGLSTTKPGEHTIVGVRITDTRLVVYPNTREARGVVATFTIENKGKKPHDFVLMGKKSGRILPGRSAVFSLTLLKRGRYLYRSTLDTGTTFRGYFTVY
jgi:hypothetical protein